LDGRGGVAEYAGGCESWLSQLSSPQAKGKATIEKLKSQEAKKAPAKKLLNREKEALLTLPQEIEKMEAERDRITLSMQAADYYRNPQNNPLTDQKRLEDLEIDILAAYEKWEELEARAKAE
jgi:ATP-binding cassette subfamily F protein uup